MEHIQAVYKIIIYFLKFLLLHPGQHFGKPHNMDVVKKKEREWRNILSFSQVFSIDKQQRWAPPTIVCGFLNKSWTHSTRSEDFASAIVNYDLLRVVHECNSVFHDLVFDHLGQTQGVFMGFTRPWWWIQFCLVHIRTPQNDLFIKSISKWTSHPLLGFCWNHEKKWHKLHVRITALLDYAKGSVIRRFFVHNMAQLIFWMAQHTNTGGHYAVAMCWSLRIFLVKSVVQLSYVWSCNWRCFCVRVILTFLTCYRKCWFACKK